MQSDVQEVFFFLILLTISLWEVWGSVQVGSTHVIAVPLGADPSLLGSLVTATCWQLCGRRSPICGDGCVLIHDAAKRPSRARVFRCRPRGRITIGGNGKDETIRGYNDERKSRSHLRHKRWKSNEQNFFRCLQTILFKAAESHIIKDRKYDTG